MSPRLLQHSLLLPCAVARLKVAPPRRGADFPWHGFAFLASNPLRALRFRLALPLPIPCAFLALGGRENFFQSLEKRRKIFPIVGKFLEGVA